MKNIFEIYSLIFTDSLVSNLGINFNKEFALESAKIFGSYDHTLMVIIASFAAFLAYNLNYLFGRMLGNVFGKEDLPSPADKVYHLLLLASIVPVVGKFIVVLAGFKRLAWLRVLAVCGTLKFCYYFAKVFIQ